MTTKDFKIKILTEKLEEVTGKKVSLKEFSFVGPAGGMFDKIDKKVLELSYRYLLNTLSPRSQQALTKYAAGATGWNRGWMICRLAYLFGFQKAKSVGGRGMDEPITKSSLRSYTNTDLFALIENGDLVPSGKGRGLIPNTSIYNNPELIELIKKVEQITGKKVILQ